MDKVFCEPMGGSLADLNPRRLFPQGQNAAPSVIEWPSAINLLTPEVLPYQGLSVGLCSWQAARSAVLVAGSALVSAGPRAAPHTPPPWLLCSRAHWATAGLARKEAEWHSQDGSPVHLIITILPH